MSDVSKIEFGSNLRPSTVAVIKKVNEIVDAINANDLTNIKVLSNTVTDLSGKVTTLQSQMTTANSKITQNTSNIETLNTDMDKVKVTLYTPLTEKE